MLLLLQGTRYFDFYMGRCGISPCLHNVVCNYFHIGGE